NLHGTFWYHESIPQKGHSGSILDDLVVCMQQFGFAPKNLCARHLNFSHLLMILEGMDTHMKFKGQLMGIGLPPPTSCLKAIYEDGTKLLFRYLSALELDYRIKTVSKLDCLTQEYLSRQNLETEKRDRKAPWELPRHAPGRGNTIHISAPKNQEENTYYKTYEFPSSESVSQVEMVVLKYSRFAL
ncbi:hypothetical protein STEG23_032360, partial [Scotinomys teguina]